ncbi:MAG: addiction module protein [Cyanobium sp. D14.bin.5]|nr:addiction module protein [Cyanobium sp. D14.bin.5]
MSPLLKCIEEQARPLGAEDRARLAETMLESLQLLIADIEAAWAAEIEDRVNIFHQVICLPTALKKFLAKPAKLCGEASTLC